MRDPTRLIAAALLSLLAALSLLAGAPTAAAQASEWRERATGDFAILYAPGGEDTAERYAGFVDQIYDEVTGAFGHRVATPITLRLYPDLESYYAVNPRARGMTGIVAHTDYRRNEVVVILPQTTSQTEVEVANNIRHELTHMVAADMSANRLNPGFQEGVAQYMERPAPERDRKLALLRQALAANQLLPWSALDDRDVVYGSPDVAYPQTLAIVEFLAQRSSFAKVVEFLTVSATSSGYRSALEKTFGASPDALEQEWLAWLPGFLAGAPQAAPAAPAGYDLSRAEAQIQQGGYADALRELEAALPAIQAAGQPGEAAKAQQLIDRARSGMQADQVAQSAHDALAAFDYEAAWQRASQAQQVYQALGDARQQAVLAEYAERAERGQRAARELTQAAALAAALRYPQARALADEAAALYTALGDRDRAAKALELRGFLDQRQALVGGVLLLFGVGGAAISLTRRLLTPEPEPW